MTEKMDFNGLRLEYALEGTTNFVAWKIHMEEVLYENGILDYIETNVIIPSTSNFQDLSHWKKDVAKARRIILEGVRDPIVSNLHEKEN